MVSGIGDVIIFRHSRKGARLQLHTDVAGTVGNLTSYGEYAWIILKGVQIPANPYDRKWASSITSMFTRARWFLVAAHKAIVGHLATFQAEYGVDGRMRCHVVEDNLTGKHKVYEPPAKEVDTPRLVDAAERAEQEHFVTREPIPYNGGMW